MVSRILPQQIVPPTRQMARLTSKFLSPTRQEMAAYFLMVREAVDTDLAARMPDYNGKPYPQGRCQEITGAVLSLVQRRLAAPKVPMEKALRSFVSAGGTIRMVWGALRGRFFQNALQIGDLYVDVSNDTVVTTKPKVEILPLAESGLENIRDAAHFAEVASAYWDVHICANHVLPGLAPVMPMISWRPGAIPQIQAANDYMIELFRSEGFHRAEAWLRDGPPPPPDVTAKLLAIAPVDLHPVADGRAEALLACATARSGGAATDPAWRNARVADYLRIPGGDHKGTPPG